MILTISYHTYIISIGSSNGFFQAFLRRYYLSSTKKCQDHTHSVQFPYDCCKEFKTTPSLWRDYCRDESKDPPVVEDDT